MPKLSGRKKSLAPHIFPLLFLLAAVYLMWQYSFRTPFGEETCPPIPETYDIIVIGGGPEGILSALAAAGENTDVLYIDISKPEAGGKTVYLPVFWAAGTPAQEEREINYPPELMAREIYNRGGETGNYSQILSFCLASAEALNWLETLVGAAYPVPDPAKPGLHYDGELSPTAVFCSTEALLPQFVCKRSRSLQPLRLLEENGKVKGVVVKNERGNEEEVLSRAVILADGGYGSNPEMLQNIAGKKGVLARPEGGHEGEGLRLALAAGARTAALESVFLSPFLLSTGEKITLTEEEASDLLFFNKNGEVVEKEAGLEELLAANHGISFLVAGNNGTFPSGIPCARVEDLNLLSLVLKTEAETLAPAVEELQPPYRVAVVGLLALTPGGLAVDEKYCVKGEKETIKGLYAAGEITGGLHGGTAQPELFWAECIVSSYLAGKNAAAWARR